MEHIEIWRKRQICTISGRSKAKLDAPRYFVSIDHLAEITDGQHAITLCHYLLLTWKYVRRSYMIHGYIQNNTTVETVVQLSKGEIDSQKVRVEFSLKDMDMSEFQKGATYGPINAYALGKFGLKVSSLHIS